MTDSDRPFVLVEGSATDEEVAALVTVLQGVAAAAAATAASEQPKAKSAWAAPARTVRVAHPHGRNGWRASGLPR